MTITNRYVWFYTLFFEGDLTFIAHNQRYDTVPASLIDVINRLRGVLISSIQYEKTEYLPQSLISAASWHNEVFLIHMQYGNTEYFYFISILRRGAELKDIAGSPRGRTKHIIAPEWQGHSIEAWSNNSSGPTSPG